MSGRILILVVILQAKTCLYNSSFHRPLTFPSRDSYRRHLILGLRGKWLQPKISPSRGSSPLQHLRTLLSRPSNNSTLQTLNIRAHSFEEDACVETVISSNSSSRSGQFATHVHFMSKCFPEKTDNRPLELICFLLPIKVSREFDFLLCINYAYICRWIRNLKETFLWSIITWPTLGKQNIQFQVVCLETVLSFTDLIHLRKRQRYVMHNVYLNSPFVVMSDSKLKFESLSGYDRCCRYLTILRAP